MQHRHRLHPFLPESPVSSGKFGKMGALIPLSCKILSSLDLEEGSVKDITDKEGKKKIGVLRDGRNVNVREKSLEGHPTLEIIQPDNTRIKIRYKD